MRRDAGPSPTFSPPARSSTAPASPRGLCQGTACTENPAMSSSARIRGCSMLVVISHAPAAVTSAQTSAGSSLRTTRSSSLAVTQATPGCELNRAAS